MFTIDPASLILTNGLVSIALAAVLLFARLGLGPEARGVRTWVLADLTLAAARMFAAAAVAGFPIGGSLPFPVLPGAFAMFGLVWHVQAMRRLRGQEIAPALMLAQALAFALLFAVPAAQMDSLTHRLRCFDGMIIIGAIALLYAAWPLRRFKGAQLIALTMGLAIGFQSLRFGAVLLGLNMDLGPRDVATPHTGMRPASLVIDLIVGLFITGGFVLLLQERVREHIERLVVTDALTGALNRHGFMPLLTQALAQSQRQQRLLALALLDLDHFKQVNDRHGHAVGDEVLAGFAAQTRAQLRAGDALGRWGGEEFLVMLPDTSSEDAISILERLRTRMAAAPVNSDLPRVSFSGGLATAAEVDQGTRALEQMLDLVDQRLYLAKRRRDCVVSEGGQPKRPARGHAGDPDSVASGIFVGPESMGDGRCR